MTDPTSSSLGPDPRAANPTWLPFALLALALASGDSVESTTSAVLAESGTARTASDAQHSYTVSDRDVVRALARIHDDLTENAVQLDAEIQDAIDAHLWELYS